MLNLEFLKGPLMNAAGLAGKLPMPTGTGTTAPKPMLTGMFGKAGKMLGQAPPLPEAPPTAPAPLATPAFDPLANRGPAVRMGTEDRVEDVPIPALPGRTGGPRPFDANTKAEFDYVMSKVPRDAAGNERKLTFGERFKKSLLPALLGTVQGINSPAGQRDPLAGAIGGAAAGFGGGMIDPISARQYEFNQMYLPELDAQEEQRQQEAGVKQKADEALVNLEARRAGIDHTKAQTESLREGIGLNQQYKQSQITLNKAREDAIRTGKPQVRDVVGDDGLVRTYNVYPDGSMVELGGSAKAAMNTENNQTRKTIADNRNATQVTIANKRGSNAMEIARLKDRGQTGRTAMVQAGQDRRATGGAAAPKPKAASGGSKRQAFIDRAVNAGYSRQEAEQEAKRRGLQ